MTMAMRAITAPESMLWPNCALRMEESTSQPISEKPPMMAAMMTTLSTAMVVWFTPTRIWGMAVGTSTCQKRWRRVQPLICPDSLIAGGTCCSPSSVLRTMGGMA